jgi:hypothetical protein
VKVILEEAAGAQAMALEKGMIVLSTAVAGGPFIGLLGTVWGVMSTFAGIAEKNSASLTTMAPGVAAALVATVTGLLVAIPAMFGYNFMVTTIRAITQELDGFASRYANQIEHVYVDHRPLAEEIRDANEVLATRITERVEGRNPGALSDEKVFANGASFADGVEHHAAAGSGVRAAGDFHHHDDSAGEGSGFEAAEAVRQMKDPPPKANYISVLADGTLYLNKQTRWPMRFGHVADAHQPAHQGHPDLNVIVRGDAQTKYKQIRAVLDVCQQANVPKVDLATEPLKRGFLNDCRTPSRARRRTRRR